MNLYELDADRMVYVRHLLRTLLWMLNLLPHDMREGEYRGLLQTLDKFRPVLARRRSRQDFIEQPSEVQ